MGIIVMMKNSSLLLCKSRLPYDRVASIVACENFVRKKLIFKVLMQ